MTLPPKAITALVAIKAELLSKQPVESVIITHEQPKSRVKMRHARRPNSYQKMQQHYNQYRWRN